MTPLPHSAEALGKLRALKQCLAEQAAQVEHAINVLPLSLADALVLRGSQVGRTRAAVKLRARFPGVARWYPLREDEDGVPYLLGVYLSSTNDPLITTPTDPGMMQGLVMTRYVLVGSRMCTASTGLWTLEIPDHALLRLFARDRSADPSLVMMAAHERVTVAAPRLELEQFIVPAGRGGFICEWIAAKDQKGYARLHVRARTWIHEDQMRDDQVGMVLARAGPEGECLGSRALDPLSMIRPQINDIRERREWTTQPSSSTPTRSPSPPGLTGTT